MGCTDSRSTKPDNLKLVHIIENPNKGESPIYRNPLAKDGLWEYNKKSAPDVKTVQDLLKKAYADFAKLPCLGTREIVDGKAGAYKWKTYGEVKELAEKFGAGLLEKKLYTDSGDDLKLKFVGIWAKNREEWAIFDQACTLYHFCALPMYDSLGVDAIEFVFKSTKVNTFITYGQHTTDLLKAHKSKGFESLKNVIVIDTPTEDQKKLAGECQIQLVTFDEVVKAGESSQHKGKYADVTPDDVFGFCYTSGTTSEPKAAMITHRNVLATTAGSSQCPGLSLKEFPPGKGNLVYLSFLPLSHIFERINTNALYSRGIAMGFFQGDVLKIRDDLMELKPTVLAAVPRLYNKFFSVIKDTISKFDEKKKAKVNKVINKKLDNLKNYGAYKHKLYDKVAFSKMKRAVGGRVQCCVSGSAPLSAEVSDFLKIAFYCPILEGFGATETTSGCILQNPDQYLAGDCGAPMVSCEVKVIDVEEMKYTSKDETDGKPTPRGELLIRGPNIFKGYYKAEEKTKEAIDKDGWYHTGDIAKILPNGSVKIVDRRKNIFKLSQGEYIAPEKVENLYVLHPCVAEVWVNGDSTRDFCVVFVVPEKEPFEKFAQQHGAKGFEDGLTNETVKAKLLEEMNAEGKKGGLKGLELAKKIYLEKTSLAQERFMTPTAKFKRNELRDHYKDIIDQMYGVANPASKV